MPTTLTLRRALYRWMLLVAVASVVGVAGLYLIGAVLDWRQAVGALRRQARAERQARIQDEVERAIAAIQRESARARADQRRLLGSHASALAAVLPRLPAELSPDEAIGQLTDVYRSLHRRAEVPCDCTVALADRSSGTLRLASQEVVATVVPLSPELADELARHDEDAATLTLPLANSPTVPVAALCAVRRLPGDGRFLLICRPLTAVDRIVREETLAALAARTVKNVGYVFAGTWAGVSLLGPAAGRNMLHADDPHAAAVVGQLIAKARAGGGFVEYVMPRVEGQKPALKISYVEAVPAWEWYVGAGVYVDDIEVAVAARQAAFWSNVRRFLLQLGIVLAVILLFAFLVTRHLSARALSEMQRFSRILGQAADDETRIDPSQFAFQEFADLAGAANAMIEAREQLEGRFTKLVEHLPLPVMVGEPDGRTLYLNRRFTTFLGYALADIPDDTAWWSCAYPDAVVRDRIRKTWRDNLEKATHGSGVIITREAPVTCKDGRRRILSITSAIVGNRLVTVFVDLTERVQIEEALRQASAQAEEARALLQAAMQNSPAGIVIVASDAGVRFANRAAYQLAGAADLPAEGERATSLNHWLGTHLFGPEPEREPLAAWIARTGSTVTNREVTVPGTGGDRHILVNAAPVSGPAGDPATVVLVFLDLTEQREIEERLRQNQRLDSIGQLAGGIAHDFNNQLAGVVGYAELLRDQLVEPGPRDHLDRILRAAHRATDLTAKLLAFSRRGQYRRVPVDLNLLIAEVAGVLEHTIDPRIDIVVRPAASPVVVLGDPTQLENAILNLALNARDAMANGGQLSLLAGDEILDGSLRDADGERIPAGAYAQVTVADTGCGIPDAIRERIFEPFFTTKAEGKGTGMGLAAVYGTIKRHGGYLTLTTAPGAGTTFRLLFAAHDAAPATADSPAALDVPTAREGGGGARLLIVEDERLIRDLESTILSQHGHTVIACADGAAAVERLRQADGAFDLVLLDMITPGLSGAETFRAMRAIAPSIRILIVSGHSRDAVAQELLRDGGTAFLPKPFLSQDLLAMVNRMLGGEPD